MIGRFLAVLHARNIEFLRDRSTMGWNIVLPVVLVFGLATVFSSPQRALFKVGVVTDMGELSQETHPILDLEYIDFIEIEDRAEALIKVERHQLDMLVDLSTSPTRFWINEDSRNGYMLERLISSRPGGDALRQLVTGKPVRYIDWLVPGILGMNMMFSCLFGVGYVVVRYRKNGFLKRLHATPLTALEFASAQIVSRLLLIMSISVAVFAGTDYLLEFRMEGSYVDLFLVATLGAFCMVALGFLVASRIRSEELAGGLLNLASWPMMVLSGVWFSLEGTGEMVQRLARVFPLTHMLDAARAIMLDGAGLAGVAPQLAWLTGMSVLFLGAGAFLFRWQAD